LFRRQDAPEVFEINASIYIFRRNALLKKNKLLNKKTIIYLMPRERSADIDDIYDFNIVKLYMKKNEKLFK
jgi:CMP-N-acetylneuraminic acid synthetase